MIKKLLSCFILILLLFITGCNNTGEKTNELIEFLRSESINDFNELKELVIINLSDDTIKNNINNISKEYLDKIYDLDKVSEISKLNEDYKKKIYDQVPINATELHFTITSEEEKEKVLNLLDKYLYRTNLIGIPLTKSYSLNLNSTSFATWEYFFGENGIKKQTPKNEYWDVKAILSNEYFIRGLNLCLDKELFKNFESINNDSQIDYSKYDYYNYNLEKAKKYFKLAIEELVETNVYNLVEDSNITLNIEIAYGQFTDKNKCKEIHNIIKKSIEEAFNSDEVSSGNFIINVTSWTGEYFGQIFSEKLYCGKYDISFDKISGSGLDFSLYREYLLRSSNSDISNNLTTNWSHDTGKTVSDCIIYNGYKYSYDEILLALSKNK